MELLNVRLNLLALASWLSYKLSNILWHLIWFWLWLLLIYLIVGELDIRIILSREGKLRYSFTFMILNSMINNVN